MTDDPWSVLAERVHAALGQPGPASEIRLRVEPRAGGQVAVSLADVATGQVLEVPLTAGQVREFTGALSNAVRTR